MAVGEGLQFSSPERAFDQSFCSHVQSKFAALLRSKSVTEIRLVKSPLMGGKKLDLVP